METTTTRDVAVPTSPVAARAQSRSRLVPMLFVGLAALAIGAIAGTYIGRARDNADPVATVNGVPITRQQFHHRLEIAAGDAVLRQMIAEEKQVQFAERMGVTPSNADVEAKYAEAEKQPNFAENIRKSHQTPEDVKRSLLINLSQAAVINKGVTVSDADVQAFYAAQTDKRNPQARYYRPETVNIAVIVTDQADDVKKALHDLASGADFRAVAQRYSKDKSAANGGVLPPVQRGRVNPKQFPGLEDKIFSMKPGQQIDNAKIAGAWWIIRCINHLPEETIPFDKVKEECRQGAMLTKGLQANGKNMQAELDTFQKEANVKANWPQYQDAVSAK